MVNKIRYVIVGSDWRSMFYVRIAKVLPEKFEVCAMLCRTNEKAKQISSPNRVICSEKQIWCK